VLICTVELHASTAQENEGEDVDEDDVEFEAALSQMPLDDIVDSRAPPDEDRPTAKDSQVHPEVAALLESGGLDWLEEDGDVSF
jgi:hypothetical protein